MTVLSATKYKHCNAPARWEETHVGFEGVYHYCDAHKPDDDPQFNALRSLEGENMNETHTNGAAPATTFQDVANASAELPSLDRVPGVGETYEGDHRGERSMELIDDPLTSFELQAKHNDFDSLLAEEDALRAAFETVKAHHKEALESNLASQKQIRSVIRARAVKREVECSKIRDERRNEIVIVRRDNGAIVSREAMSIVQLQESLPLLDSVKRDDPEDHLDSATDTSDLALSEAGETKRAKKPKKEAAAEALA